MASAFHRVVAGIKSNPVPRWNRVYPCPTLLQPLESMPTWNWFSSWNRLHGIDSKFLNSLKILPLGHIIEWYVGTCTFLLNFHAPLNFHSVMTICGMHTILKIGIRAFWPNWKRLWTKLKGTVAWDFLVWGFLGNQVPPGPWFQP